MILYIGKNKLQEVPRTRFRLDENQLTLVSVYDHNQRFKIQGDKKAIRLTDKQAESVKEKLLKAKRPVAGH